MVWKDLPIGDPECDVRALWLKLTENRGWRNFKLRKHTVHTFHHLWGPATVWGQDLIPSIHWKHTPHCLLLNNMPSARIFWWRKPSLCLHEPPALLTWDVSVKGSRWQTWVGAFKNHSWAQSRLIHSRLPGTQSGRRIEKLGGEAPGGPQSPWK